MDWENENWVKLYTRDTGEMVGIGWEARALLREMLCKCDRAGIVDAENAEALAALVRMPVEIVTRCNAALQQRNVVSRTECGLLINNFLVAQEARTSNKERQRRFRERSRDSAKLAAETVTPRNAESHDVTNRVEKSRVEKSSIARKRAQPIPKDWKPHEKHALRADELRLNCIDESEAYRNHALSKGRKLVDWDAGFFNWLKQSAKYQADRTGSRPHAPRLQRL